MTKEEIETLIVSMKRQVGEDISLIETHISWVILTKSFVYKIKKCIRYSFLDYSTLQKRRYYCYKELVLNRRVARDIYLDVVPVRFKDRYYSVNTEGGVIVDYAVKMKRMNQDRLMINLLNKNQVKDQQIVNLAKEIARFHHSSDIIVDAFPWRKFDAKFADIAGVQEFVSAKIGRNYQSVITIALKKSTMFLRANSDLLNKRAMDGFIRDVHGDLHAKNIFLYDRPVIFDCIEFNDDHRQMDLLNELAFCCMDLEANDRWDFSKLLLETYLKLMPAIRHDDEMRLFTYYKAYRANVRAKVNVLRAKQEMCSERLQRTKNLVNKYLELMNHYLALI